jgi:cytidine deaminase
VNRCRRLGRSPVGELLRDGAEVDDLRSSDFAVGYTSSYAGVALKTRDGGIFTGSVAENAAFNPSMSPLEAAIVNLVISGGKSYADIVDAVLVDAVGSKASQAAATHDVLRTITSVSLRIYQAHAPHTNFFVGTVALGSSGSIYFGANYEFPGQALSFTVHGEQAATAHAISCGESGMQMLAVSAAPCGYCRQFLYELTSDSPAEYARHFSNIAYPQRVRARRPGRYCGVDVSAIPWYDAFTNNSRSSGEGGVGGSQLLLRALYIDKGSNHRRYGCAATLSFWQH